MTTMRRWMMVVGLGFACANPFLAQGAKQGAPAPAEAQADQPSTMQVNAKLVVVPVAVRDKKGELVKGLAKEDFSLMVGGKDQPIRYFDQDKDLPLTLGLLVDVSRSMQDSLPDERKASQSFLDSLLVGANPTRTSDKAFVIHFAHDIEMLQDVTDDRVKLEKALKELGTESSGFHTATEDGGYDSEQRRVRGRGTSLYDAVFLAGDEVLQNQKGRKALVVLTDGVDSGSKEALTETIESVQRADTTVYAVYYKGNQRQPDQQQNGGRRGGGYPGGGVGFPGGGYPRGGGGGYPQSPGSGGGGNNPQGGGGPTKKPNVDGRQVLERLCGETGGRVFEVSRKQPIEEIYKQIGEELRSQYRLGFTPDAGQRSGYHQIDLRMTGKYKDQRMDVQARDGYYTGEK